MMNNTKTPIPIMDKFTEEQKQLVIELYSNQNLTQEEISVRLGCPRRTICKLIKHLETTNPGLRKTHKTAQKSKRDPKVEQRVLELREAGKTVEDIARAVGLATSSVSRICSKYNQPVLDRNKKVDDTEVKKLYESGMGQNKIAEQLDVSKVAIVKSLDRTNTPRRAPIIKSTIIKRQISLPPFEDSKEWFTEAYINRHYGMPSIASFIGRSVGYVANKLDSYGIVLRTVSDGNRKYEKDYVLRIFEECNQNISMTSRVIGCDPWVVRTVTREAGYTPIDPSTKFSGEGNPFYGQKHTDDNIELCTKIGAENGLKFWQENPEYVEVVKQKTKEYWSDPVKRLEDSVRIAKLRIQGKCNAKQSIIDSRFGLINCDSSYEAKFIEECENNQSIEFVEREYEPIEYEFEGNKHNYVPDFRIWFEDGDFKVIEIKSRYWHDADIHATAKRNAAMSKFGERYEYRLIEKE